jgi:hypothetical protein
MCQGSVGRIPGGFGRAQEMRDLGLATDNEFVIRVVQGITRPLSRRGPCRRVPEAPGTNRTQTVSWKAKVCAA